MLLVEVWLEILEAFFISSFEFCKFCLFQKPYFWSMLEYTCTFITIQFWFYYLFFTLSILFSIKAQIT